MLLLNLVYNLLEIEKSDKCIPKPIRFYNSLKFDINVTHQMARKYSVKSKSRQ